MIIAVLDANVLIPNALCDMLLRLAEEDVYSPRWSMEILDEVRRNLPGLPATAVERRISFIFLLGPLHREPMLLVRIVREQAADTGRYGPKLSPDEILHYLAAAGARLFATAVRPILQTACGSIE